jgi:hypothetical protein
LVTFYEGNDIEAKFKELDGIGWRDKVPAESAEDRRKRQTRVAERRADLAIICHRGASEFAHENTLEAYRATFELGADGNEVDIRETKDGVLVCFHDDMLDQILVAYGDVSDNSWNELRRFRFRRPGPYGKHTQIPTLAQVFALHREHAGLMHLDIKRPGLGHKIAQLLDQFDLWEHVMSAPAENGAAIVADPRYKPLRYKTQLYTDHRDVDPREIEKAMKLEGTALIVDDPRGSLVASGRNLASVSSTPVLPIPQQLIEFETGAVDWPEVVPIDHSLGRGPWRDQFDGDDEHYRVAALLVAQARSMERMVILGAPKDSGDGSGWADGVRERIPLRDWRYHGIDAAVALRILVAHGTPNAVDVARECLWRDDPALDEVRDPKFNTPRSWHDWRIKNLVFPLLEAIPGEKTECLCRDYLALSHAEAHIIGPPQFEAAAKTLLAVSPNESTAIELLRHRHAGVRNRTIKLCLQHANQTWAVAALKQEAPHTLAYVVPARQDE